MKTSVAALFIAYGITLTVSVAAQQPESSLPPLLIAGRAIQLPTVPGAAHGVPQEPVQIRPEPPAGRTHFPGEDHGRAQVTPGQRPLDTERARREAQELAAVAQKIPSEVDQLSKNVFPKDLVQQLKQIEKLAKRLRTEISR